jgi:hypothetical protein
MKIKANFIKNLKRQINECNYRFFTFNYRNDMQFYK